MLTIWKYSKMVELLREHELFEYAIFNKNFIKADLLINQYFEKGRANFWKLEYGNNFQFCHLILSGLVEDLK